MSELSVVAKSKGFKTGMMDVQVKTVGAGHINDGKSVLRVQLTSEDPLARQRILSMAGLLTGQGSKHDAAVIAEWFSITEEELELAETVNEETP